MEMERAILKFYGSNVARMLENLAPAEPGTQGESANGNGDYSPARLHELAREPSLVNLVNLIVLEAIEARASDVHIEPKRDQTIVRLRIDGLLHTIYRIPKSVHPAILSRVSFPER